MVAIGGLLGLLIALTAAAGPVTRYLEVTSDQLFNPKDYVAIVLTTPGKKIKSGDDGHGKGTEPEPRAALAPEETGSDDPAQKDH